MPRVKPRMLLRSWGCGCEEEPAHSQQTNTTQVRLAITRRTPHMGTSAPPSAAVCAPPYDPCPPYPHHWAILTSQSSNVKVLNIFEKNFFPRLTLNFQVVFACVLEVGLPLWASSECFFDRVMTWKHALFAMSAHACREFNVATEGCCSSLSCLYLCILIVVTLVVLKLYELREWGA